MCDGVAAYRTSLCQSPAIWSRIRAISSPGTATNTSDKSKRRQFVGLIYNLTKFVTRACRPEAEQWSHKADKLTARSANGRMLQRRALIDHLLSATRHKGVIGHYVLPHGTGCCLWTHGFSGCRARRRPLCRWWWGFALHEALRRRIDGVSEHHVVQFPPFGGGEITV